MALVHISPPLSRDVGRDDPPRKAQVGCSYYP